MLKLSQLADKKLFSLQGKEYFLGCHSIDDGPGDGDDLMYNLYPFTWESGPDIAKPFFTESASWYIVVERRTFPGTEAEQRHKGFLSKDILLVAMNVHDFEEAEVQRY